MNGSEQLGRWISNNPIIIIFATLLITLSALHYAQQIEMQGLTTEIYTSLFVGSVRCV